MVDRWRARAWVCACVRVYMHACECADQGRGPESSLFVTVGRKSFSNDGVLRFFPSAGL